MPQRRKGQDRNNRENNYLQVNFTGHEAIQTEQSKCGGVAGFHRRAFGIAHHRG